MMSTDLVKNIKAKLYCPSMWKSVHVDVDSYLTPCCLFIHGDDKKTRITDANVEKIETVLLDEFQEYRDQLTEGIWPAGCNQCKFAEEEGRASKRQQDMHSLTYGPGDSSIMLSPPEEVHLEYLQLKTGRLCNLECTICTPSCSTSIAATQLKKGVISRELYDQLQDEIKWTTSLDQFKKMNPELGFYRIDIAGGEPLMNKTHFMWLNQLQNTSQTQLLYNTNGTWLPNEKEVDIWKKYKGLWISFSVDSYGKRFEELRVNAKWDDVLYKMKYMTEEVVRKQLAHQGGHTNTAIVMTIHEGNVNDIFDLWDIVTNEINWIQDDPINFNYLYYPEHLAIHNMSKERLQDTIENFEKNMHRLPKGLKIRREAENLQKSMETFLGDKIVEHTRPIGSDHRG